VAGPYLIGLLAGRRPPLWEALRGAARPHQPPLAPSTPTKQLFAAPAPALHARARGAREGARGGFPRCAAPAGVPCRAGPSVGAVRVLLERDALSPSHALNAGFGACLPPLWAHFPNSVEALQIPRNVVAGPAAAVGFPALESVTPSLPLNRMPQPSRSLRPIVAGLRLCGARTKRLLHACQSSSAACLHALALGVPRRVVPPPCGTPVALVPGPCTGAGARLHQAVRPKTAVSQPVRATAC
jgi:hypothetical protein